MRSGGLGIRSLVYLSSLLLFVLVVSSVAVLIVAALIMQDSMESMSRDTHGAAIADDLGVATLMFQRLGNVAWVGPNPELLAARGEQAFKVRQLLAELPAYAGGPEEEEIIRRLSEVLPAYLDRRAELDASGAPLEEILRTSSPMFGEVLDLIGELRLVNDRQVEAASDGAARALRLSVLFAALLMAMFVTALLVVGAGVRRYLARPILSLHRAMGSFRDGDLTARGPVHGSRELREVGRMFNDMAATLAQQRRAQLEFLAGVAHDLKNPMSTLKNGMYLLAVEPAVEQRERMRGMLDKQVDLLVRMVDDFLDASRIEAGELELRCIEFDVRLLARELVHAYEALVPGRRLALDEPPDPVSLHADPMRVEQVLRNLLSNAIKYSAEGDIVVAIGTAGDEAVLEVRDQGVGIAPEDQAQIFLPFRRRHSSVASGAGLGLSVVRRIVHAHGGRIEVESVVGQGSTFRVQLPLAQSDTMEQASPLAKSGG